MDSNKSVKITKKSIALLIILLLIASGLIVYFPKYKKQSEINTYKKALYDSILCQYECPPQNITMFNQTQVLPGRDCVVECINQLKNKGYIKNQYSEEEISNDNLALDIETTIANCKNSNLNNETGETDSEKITACALDGLKALKQNYSYLA